VTLILHPEDAAELSDYGHLPLTLLSSVMLRKVPQICGTFLCWLPWSGWQT
jgi:hypothetical protein